MTVTMPVVMPVMAARNPRLRKLPVTVPVAVVTAGRTASSRSFLASVPRRVP